MVASENGHAAVVSLLIDHGADVNAKNKVSTGMGCVDRVYLIILYCAVVASAVCKYFVASSKR